EGHSQSKIAITLERSRKCIQTYLNDRSSKKLNNKIERSKTLSPSDRRLLLREASNSRLSAIALEINFKGISERDNIIKRLTTTTSLPYIYIKPYKSFRPY
ncbi:hypothetical protein A3Q56_08339, partial [Intoshia linei]